MENNAALINRFLVYNFNNLLRWEQKVLSGAMNGRLSVSEYHVIEAVIAREEFGENTMGEIAARLGVTVGTLTTAVKTLEKKGFLLRQKGDVDKRTVRLSPTALAVEANTVHKEFHRRMVGGIMDCLDHQQLTALTSALEVLGDWFASAEAETGYILVNKEEDIGE